MPVAAQVPQPRHPISESQFRQCVQWLRLDADQAVLAEDFFREYQVSWESQLLERVRAFWKESEGATRQFWDAAQGKAALAEELFPPLVEESEAIIAHMDELEAAFFENLKSILRDDQVQYMPRLRNGLFRLRAVRHQYQLPEGNVDLVDLVETLNLGPELYDRVEEEVIIPYERDYVEGLKKTFDAIHEFYQRNAKTYELHDRMISSETPGHVQLELSKEIEDQRAAAARRQIAAMKDVVELNRRALVQLVDLLPSDKAQELHAEFLRQAYGEVYPDPTPASELYDAAMALDDLTDQQVESLESFRAEWCHRWQFISQQMEEAVYERYWATYASRPSRLGTHGELRQLLKQKGYEREQWNLQQIKYLQQILRPGQFAKIPEWDFENAPPRRVWDHDAMRVWEDWNAQRERERMNREAMKQLKKQREKDAEDKEG